MKHFIIDVDGCLTDGTFTYTEDDGKFSKTFGPDDNDALHVLKRETDCHVMLISSDRRGVVISRKRAVDMNCEFTWVEGGRPRLYWARKRFIDLGQVIFMGDSFTDVPLLEACGFAIAPANAHYLARQAAANGWVCTRSGGQRAVCEAVEQILKTFYGRSLI